MSALAKGQTGDLRARLFFLLGALIVYRIGSHIPISGIDSGQLKAIFEQGSGGLLDLLVVFSGGSISRLSVLTLGILPYITSSIIVNLATVSFPTLQSLRKEGTMGRRKITQYTRYGTVLLATFQSYVVAAGLESQPELVLDPGSFFRATTMVSFVTGAVFLMWLGEQITERGIGNGISLLIFASIVSGLPSAIGGTLEFVRVGTFSPLFAMVLFIAVLLVLMGIVFVERGQRRVLINYAKRQVGNKLYGGQRSHLPFKLNMAGVMPAIFAYAIVLFPTTLAGFSGQDSTFMSEFAALFTQGEPLYLLLLALTVIFFCFFYTALVYNPRETADVLRKSGAFIPGIRPGEQTAIHIGRIVMRLTLVASVYITTVALMPELLQSRFGIPFYFGGTSLLIIVVVSMDFIEQVQHYLMTQQYSSLLKKTPGGMDGVPGR